MSVGSSSQVYATAALRQTALEGYGSKTYLLDGSEEGPVAFTDQLGKEITKAEESACWRWTKRVPLFGQLLGAGESFLKGRAIQATMDQLQTPDSNDKLEKDTRTLFMTMRNTHYRAAFFLFMIALSFGATLAGGLSYGPLQLPNDAQAVLIAGGPGGVLLFGLCYLFNQIHAYTFVPQERDVVGTAVHSTQARE